MRSLATRTSWGRQGLRLPVRVLDRRCDLEGARPSLSATRFGQVAQSVEQGTENPRVGGSIPSLATLVLLSVGLVACGPPCSAAAVWVSRCEKLCCDVADALEPCIDDTFAWSDLGATSKVDYVRQCFTQWDRTVSGLTAYEIQQATLVCRDVRRELRELDPDDPGRCAELRAVYAELP